MDVRVDDAEDTAVVAIVVGEIIAEVVRVLDLVPDPEAGT